MSLDDSNADDYYQEYSGGPWRHKSSVSKAKGASHDPNKCTHPTAVGENCEFCGVYVRGDRMG